MITYKVKAVLSTVVSPTPYGNPSRDYDSPKKEMLYVVEETGNDTNSAFFVSLKDALEYKLKLESEMGDDHVH